MKSGGKPGVPGFSVAFIPLSYGTLGTSEKQETAAVLTD
jgi:hypothetical protein